MEITKCEACDAQIAGRNSVPVVIDNAITVERVPAVVSPVQPPTNAPDTAAAGEELVSAVLVEMNIGDLRVHPKNVEIYGEGSVEDLVKSIEKQGAILEPLLVTTDGTIIGGHRRFRAAMKLKFTKVPVRVFPSTDELEILQALLEHNRQRVKSKSQLAKECTLEIEIQKAMRERGAAHGKGAGANLPPGREKKSRDAVGKIKGISGRSVDKAVKATKAIAQLKAEGREKDAEELTAALDKGFDSGIKCAIEKGVVSAPTPKKSNKSAKVALDSREPAVTAPISRQTEKVASEMSGAVVPKSKGDIEDALTKLDEVLTCLRALGPDDLTDQQKRDWRKLLDQIDDCRADLNL